MTKKRFIAFLIDLIIVTILSIIKLIFILSCHNTNDIDIVYYLYNSIMGFLIFSDIIYKSSIGKKIMKLEIRFKNDEIPSIIIILMRNFFIVTTWPIGLVLILLKKELVGDMLCRTKIIEKED